MRSRGQFPDPTFLSAAIALVPISTLGLVLILQAHTSFSEPVAATSEAVAAIAIILTALYAARAYEQQRYTSRVSMTVAMMESEWLLQSFRALDGLLADQRFKGDLGEIRSHVDDVFTNDPRSQEASILKSILGTLTYVATLFNAGYYEEKVVLARGSYAIVEAYFIFQPILTRYVASRTYEHADVFNFGVAAARRMPPTQVPQLRGYVPG